MGIEENPLRVAYLILAHRQPVQLARLVSRLGDAPIFVHFDARSPASDFRLAQRLAGARANVRFVQRHRCYWGRIGIVLATLSCIDALCRSGASYDYAMLLSGQDYPIRPLEDIDGFLERARGTEFIESFALSKPNRWTHHAGAFQAMARVRDFHLWFRSRHRTLPVRRSFPRGYEPHGGSQWWCLSRPCVEYLDRLHRESPDVLRYFRHVFVPDESYFQTVIAASPFGGSIAGDDLRFAIWDRPEPPYPATLSTTDVERIATSGKLFARKFDMRADPSVLDLIDRRLLGVA